jgi:DNA-binding NarL/FixJ family response regulator
MVPIRVIVADDHPVVREGTRELLDREDDIEVVGEAADGAEAVRLVEELQPDVAVLDVSMPGMNGIEATERIKAIRPATAILILTQYDYDQYVFALLSAGAAGYLLKDIPAAEVVRAVRLVHAGEPILHPAIARKVMSHFAAQAADGDTPAGGQELTDREREILRLAACGLSNAAIASHESVSLRTVQADLTHIFEKLGVGSRTEAVIIGLKRGLFRLEDLDEV